MGILDNQAPYNSPISPRQQKTLIGKIDEYATKQFAQRNTKQRKDGSIASPKPHTKNPAQKPLHSFVIVKKNFRSNSSLNTTRVDLNRPKMLIIQFQKLSL